MKPSEAAKLVTVLFAAWPAYVSEQTSTVYEREIAPLDFALAEAAVSALMRTEEKLPSIAAIHRVVQEMARGPVRAGAEGWESFRRAKTAQGAYRSPGVDFVFSDPVVGRCVDALGWRELCLSENEVADRARFIELYDKLAHQNRREEQAPVLAAARERREIESKPAAELIERTLKLLPGGAA